MKKQTKDDFINKANEIHNNKYDYSKVDYKTSKIKVEIICLKHGSFWQRPNNHTTKKHNCPNCSPNRLNIKEFLDNSKFVHGKKYDYSKVDYVSNKKSICIICPDHGEFFLRPDNHIHYSSGCPKCSKQISKKETVWLNEWIKIPNDLNHRQIKITINNKKFKVDGFDPINNVVYEFLGDFWHGNLKCYQPNFINPVNKKTMKQLNDEVFKRFFIFGNAGYEINYIWESDFDLLVKHEKANKR